MLHFIRHFIRRFARHFIRRFARHFIRHFARHFIRHFARHFIRHFARNCQRIKKIRSDRKMKTLVFDLDETLVAHVKRKRSDFTINFPAWDSNDDKDVDKVMKHIKIRPGTKELLAYCTEKYQIGIWSMGQPNYVNAIVEKLFPDIKPLFVFNWTNCYRDSCHIYKRLEWCPTPLAETYIIDDNDDVVYETDHRIPIKAFYGNKNDHQLFDLILTL